jgi:hypothetical protein
MFLSDFWHKFITRCDHNKQLDDIINEGMDCLVTCLRNKCYGAELLEAKGDTELLMARVDIIDNFKKCDFNSCRYEFYRTLYWKKEFFMSGVRNYFMREEETELKERARAKENELLAKIADFEKQIAEYKEKGEVNE